MASKDGEKCDKIEEDDKDMQFRNILSLAREQAQELEKAEGARTQMSNAVPDVVIKTEVSENPPNLESCSSVSADDWDQAVIAFKSALSRNSDRMSEENKQRLFRSLCGAFGYNPEQNIIDAKLQNAPQRESVIKFGRALPSVDNSHSKLESVRSDLAAAAASPRGRSEMLSDKSNSKIDNCPSPPSHPHSPERHEQISTWIKSPQKKEKFNFFSKLVGLVSGKQKQGRLSNIDDTEAFDTLLHNVASLPSPSVSESEEDDPVQQRCLDNKCFSYFRVEDCVKYQNPTLEDLGKHLHLAQTKVEQLVAICNIKEVPLSFLTFESPTTFAVKIPVSKWEEAFDEKRAKLVEGWAAVIDECLEEIGFPCSFNADNFVKLKNDKHILTLIGHCGGECITKFKVRVEHPKPGKPVVLRFSISEKFKLLQQTPTGRELRAKKRAESKVAMTNEPPYKHFLKRELKLPIMRMLHNCHRQKSLSVLQTINSEGGKKETGVDPAAALKTVQEKLQNEPMYASSVASIDPGYVRMIWRVPFGFNVYSPLQLRYAGLCDFILLDSTGNVVKTIDGKKCLIHVLMGRLLTYPGVNAIPLLEFGLNKNDTERVKSMLSSFNNDATSLAPVWKPKLACCDFSFLYLHVLSEVFNQEELMIAVNRAYDRLTQNEPPNETIMDIMICKLHLLNAFRRVLTKHNVPQHIRQYAMHALAKLQEAPKLAIFQEATDRLISLFGCENLSENIVKQYSYDIVHDNLQHPLDEETHNWEFIIKEEEEWTGVQDTGLQREKSKFYHYFCQRESQILTTADGLRDPDAIVEAVTNPMFCPKVVQIMKDFYYPYAGLWSRCIPRNKIPTDFSESGLLTNAAVENYFFKVKEKLHPKSFMNPAIFVQDHAPLAMAMTEEALSKAMDSITAADYQKHSFVEMKRRGHVKEKREVSLPSLIDSNNLLSNATIQDSDLFIVDDVFTKDISKNIHKDVSPPNETHTEKYNNGTTIDSPNDKDALEETLSKGCDNSKRQYSIETWKKRARQRRVKYLNRFKRGHFQQDLSGTPDPRDTEDVHQHFIGLQKLICRLKGKLRKGPNKSAKTPKQKKKMSRSKIIRTMNAKIESALKDNSNDTYVTATVTEKTKCGRDVRGVEKSFSSIARKIVIAKVDDSEETETPVLVNLAMDDDGAGQSIMQVTLDSDNEDEDIPIDVLGGRRQLQRVFRFPSITGDEDAIASLSHGKWLDDSVMQGIACLLLQKHGTLIRDCLLDSFAIRKVTHKVRTQKGTEVDIIKFFHNPYARIQPAPAANARVFHTAHFPGHWILIVIDLNDKVYRVFDTKLGIASLEQKSNYVAELIKLFACKYKLSTESFKIIWERTPQQVGGHECGDMSLGLIEASLRSIDPEIFFNDYSSDTYREKQLEQLLQTSHNGLALFLNFSSHYGSTAIKQLLRRLTLRRTVRQLVYDNEAHREKLKKDGLLNEQIVTLQNSIQTNEETLAYLLPWCDFPPGRPYLMPPGPSSEADCTSNYNAPNVVNDLSSDVDVMYPNSAEPLGDASPT